jgi:hypothetical protein
MQAGSGGLHAAVLYDVGITLSYQPLVSSTFLSQQINHQQLVLSATSQQYFSLTTNQPPASSSFLSEQISNNHQPPAK